jgi:hypothetical protein
MRSLLLIAACFAVQLFAPSPVPAQARAASWRSATPSELEALLPARAPVEKERIETEMRTATGITDDRGHSIAAVVLITAGYAANGKYSHYLLVQSPIHLGAELRLAPGAYVLGWSRGEDGLLVHVFEAVTGVEKGAVTARIPHPPIRVEPFRIWPPSEHSFIQIGRFTMPYTLD